MNRNRPAKMLTCVIGLPLGCLLAAGALAQDAGDEGNRRAEAPAEPELSVPGTRRPSAPHGEGHEELESYLKLPDGFIATSPYSVSGANETEWRRRFVKASSELAEAKSSLAATKRELDGVAEGGGSSQWSVAPPGAGGASGSGGANGSSTSPLSFRLRQQLRADREKLETTEKALRELRIEADLAGVPEGWRRGKEGGAGTRHPAGGHN